MVINDGLDKINVGLMVINDARDGLDSIGWWACILTIVPPCVEMCTVLLISPLLSFFLTCWRAYVITFNIAKTITVATVVAFCLVAFPCRAVAWAYLDWVRGFYLFFEAKKKEKINIKKLQMRGYMSGKCQPFHQRNTSLMQDVSSGNSIFYQL